MWERRGIPKSRELRKSLERCGGGGERFGVRRAFVFDVLLQWMFEGSDRRWPITSPTGGPPRRLQIMRTNGRKSRNLAEMEAGCSSLAVASEGSRFDDSALVRDQKRYAMNVSAVVPLDSGDSGKQREAMSSSCGDGKGRIPEMERLLRLQCADCEELLHELSNVLTGVLMNAQVLAWKLPPYSHLKRSVREVERNAQRGGELLKRLTRRVAVSEAAELRDAAPEAVAACGPGELGRQPRVDGSSPAQTSENGNGESRTTAEGDLTGDCDTCTSEFPKKG